MDKAKSIIIGFVILNVLLLFFGISRVKSIKSQIKEQTESMRELDDRRNYVKDLERSLELRRIEGQVLRRIPRVKDPMADRVLMKKFFESFLGQMDLEAEVKVQPERASADFPAIIGVNEVTLLIGIKDYDNYSQITVMFEEFKNYPFGIETFSIGSTDIPVPGHVRIMLKYYVIPEEA
jgi:hypothetical protein